MKLRLIIAFVLVLSGNAFGQNRFIDSFNVYNTLANRNANITTISDGNSYYFMEAKDIFIAYMYMYIVTKDTDYSNYCKRMITTMRSTAQVSSTIPGNIYGYKDSYYGWIAKSPADPSVVNLEVPLYESYLTAPIFQFIYYYSLWGGEPSWVSDNLQWFTDNLWTKWKKRSSAGAGAAYPYRNFLRNRTHDGAHWAIVATVLTKIGLADSIKTQANDVVGQYDLLLQRNIKNHPTIAGASTWNGSYDNITGTQAGVAPVTPVAADVSHANHTVRYMCFAQELGNPLYTWAKNKKVANLIKGLYKNDGTFWDMFDGTFNPNRGGNWGNYQGDGWILFSKYDSSLFNIYKSILENYPAVSKGYGQTYDYRANLALAYYKINTVGPDTARRDTTNNLAVLPKRKTIAVPDETVTFGELDNVTGVVSDDKKYHIIQLGENQSSY